MAGKTRITTCTSCGQPRKAGGKTKEGVCRLCRHKDVMARSTEERRRGPYVKSGKPRGWALTVRTKRKPMPEQQWKATHLVDRDAQRPTSSWWAVKSREEFRANLEAETNRLRVIGATVPRTQMGVADSQ